MLKCVLSTGESGETRNAPPPHTHTHEFVPIADQFCQIFIFLSVTNKLNHSLELRSSLEADSRSIVKEFPALYKTIKFITILKTHNGPYSKPHDSNSRPNSLFQIHFNIVLPLRFQLPSEIFLSHVSTRILYPDLNSLLIEVVLIGLTKLFIYVYFLFNFLMSRLNCKLANQ